MKQGTTHEGYPKKGGQIYSDQTPRNIPYYDYFWLSPSIPLSVNFFYGWPPKGQ